MPIQFGTRTNARNVKPGIWRQGAVRTDRSVSPCHPPEPLRFGIPPFVPRYRVFGRPAPSSSHTAAASERVALEARLRVQALLERVVDLAEFERALDDLCAGIVVHVGFDADVEPD